MILNRCAAVALVVAGTSLGAQGKPLVYVPDLSINVPGNNMSRPGMLTVSPSGRMVLATGDWYGELVAYDSLGKKLDWSTLIGPQRESEIGWVSSMGWVGDSLWVQDDRYGQAVIIDRAGKVVRSIERPNWVRPAWGERRKYPLFGSMDWEALYPDGTMLIVPARPRALFDTPEYDRSLTHLLLVSKDGKILRTIARIPTRRTDMLLRDGTQRTTVNVPLAARVFWKTSADGKRIVVVRPLTTAADSGAFIVTMLSDSGDTVFSRRYATDARRVTAGRADSLLAAIKPFGRYTAEWIRDTLRKQMPAFESRIANIGIGVDHSTWIWLRTPAAEAQALVLDALGEPAGIAKFPPSMRLTVYSVDHIWRLLRTPTRGSPQFSLERQKRAVPTAAPRPRSGRAAGSPPSAKPPE